MNKEKSKGKVYFISAGPGDPELLTLKGLRIIKEADVILHDRLVSTEILNHAHAKATDEDSAITAVQQWSTRKMRMFRPQHIRVAWQRLVQCGWLDLPNQQMLSARG